MSKVLAFYRYPEPKGTKYFRGDLTDPNTVIEVFNYCQILLAIITKAGWEFLIDHYGYEKLFELDRISDWKDCNSLTEYKAEIDYEMSIAK